MGPSRVSQKPRIQVNSSKFKKIHDFWQLLARQGPCFCANGLLVKEQPWSSQMLILFILVVQIVYPTRPSTCLLIQRRLQKLLQHGHAIARWKSSSRSTFPAQPFPTWRNRISFVAGKSSLNELTVKSNALWMEQLLQSNELQLINSNAVKRNFNLRQSPSLYVKHSLLNR